MSDVDEWHVFWGQSGITVSEVVDRRWGMREFSVTDPAGNTLRIGNNLLGSQVPVKSGSRFSRNAVTASAKSLEWMKAAFHNAT